MEGRRDHVLGQRLTQLVPQDVGIEWPLAGVEGHEVLAVVGPPGDHDCAVADTGQPHQCVLDLADPYPKATDLALGIPPAEEPHLAPGQPAPMSAPPFTPGAPAER